VFQHHYAQSAHTHMKFSLLLTLLKVLLFGTLAQGSPRHAWHSRCKANSPCYAQQQLYMAAVRRSKKVLVVSGLVRFWFNRGIVQESCCVEQLGELTIPIVASDQATSVVTMCG
jgi:hypothetical protein